MSDLNKRDLLYKNEYVTGKMKSLFWFVHYVALWPHT